MELWLRLYSLYGDLAHWHANLGLVFPVHVTWEPYRIVLDTLLWNTPESQLKALEPANDLQLKLLVTAILLKRNLTVHWNYRLNNYRIIDIYVPSLNIGYYVADLNMETYSFVKHYRNTRLKHGLKYHVSHIKPPRIYMLTRTPKLNKHDNMWITLSGI